MASTVSGSKSFKESAGTTDDDVGACRIGLDALENHILRLARCVGCSVTQRIEERFLVERVLRRRQEHDAGVRITLQMRSSARRIPCAVPILAG